MKKYENNSNAKKEKEEYYEISFFFLFLTVALTIIALKSFGSFISFVVLGTMLILHFLSSEAKSKKLSQTKKLYKINTYKYAEYTENAC